MARSHKGVEPDPSPRNAPGPSCACCGQPYSEDIGGERIEPIAFGGFLFIYACLSCHKCPLAGPCVFEDWTKGVSKETCCLDFAALGRHAPNCKTEATPDV